MDGYISLLGIGWIWEIGISEVLGITSRKLLWRTSIYFHNILNQAESKRDNDENNVFGSVVRGGPGFS